MKTIKFGFSLFKKYLAEFMLALFLISLVVVFSLALPQVSKYIIDFVLSPTAPTDSIGAWLTSGAIGLIGTKTLLVNLVLIFVSFVVFRALFQYLSGLVQQRYGNEFGRDLRNVGIKKLLNLNDFSSTGEVYLTLTHDTFYFKELYQSIIPQLFSFILFTLFSIVLIFMANWLVGLVMCVAIPAYIVLSIFFTKRTKRFFLKSRENSSKLSQAVGEATTGIVDIRSFGYEEKEINYLQVRNENYQNNKRENAKVMAKFQFFSQITRALFYAVAIFLSGYLAIKGEITIGVFSAIVSYSIIFVDNLQNAINKVYHAEESTIYGEMFREFILSKNKISNYKTKERVEKKPNIEAKKATIVLDEYFDMVNLNFKINYGEKVGFFAPQGSGKSILSKALLRFVDTKRGAFLINGIDYHEINIDSLRSQFSFSAQVPFVFSDTIKNNIILGKTYEDKKFWKILKICDLDKFVLSLPDKENSLLHENGAGFPNQETESLSLARALYDDCPILILDSPFERILTPEGERILQNIFKEYSEKTIIILTSETQLLKNCEKLYCLKDGEIVEEGTFDELKNNTGSYFSSYSMKKEEDDE